MRRLLLTENITADGRIEMLDDWFNPGLRRGRHHVGREHRPRSRGARGRGGGLAPEGTAIPRLELLESQVFRSGVVLLRYDVASG